jgi:hypothetical protein
LAPAIEFPPVAHYTIGEALVHVAMRVNADDGLPSRKSRTQNDLDGDRTADDDVWPRLAAD